MTIAAGSRLGPYEILALLGAGGMGEVYRAKDARLSREVAIKVLPAAVASDAERLKRFEKEARSASALNHPHIVTIYDIGSSNCVSWIAMERVEGATLREILVDGPLPVKKLLQISLQIADGLAKAHESRIVHRDLKPENVMVTKDGLVKILDFCRDQFSCGEILYEMATGKRAFQKKTTIDPLGAILNAEPEPIASLNAEAPAPVRWIVERCLAKEARQRYASTEDLARDLASLRDHFAEASSSGAAAM